MTNLKNLYFSIFYNVNFIINIINGSFVLLLYLALYFIGNNEIVTTKEHITIFIYYGFYYVLLSVIGYNSVYLINDYLDRKQDLDSGRKKFNARDISGTTNYFWNTLTYVIIYFAALISVGLNEILLVFIIYTILCILVTLVHSFYKNIKYITLFLQRFLRYLFPALCMELTLSNDISSSFLLFIVFAFPILIYQSHSFYIDYKYTESKNKIHWYKKITYMSYYLTIIFFSIFSLSINYGFLFASIAFLIVIVFTCEVLISLINFYLIDDFGRTTKEILRVLYQLFISLGIVIFYIFY